MKLFSVNQILAMGALTGAMVFSLPASADAGSGVLNFSGSIVSTPCNLSMEQANQDVDLGQHKAESSGGVRDHVQNFSITFTDCTATPAKISWTGLLGTNAQRLATSTTGLIVMVQHKDTGVNVAFDDRLMTLPPFIEGENVLQFETGAYADSVDVSAIAEGPYTASANFTMHYE